MRCPLIIGNWKLNGSSYMINKLMTILCRNLANVTGCFVAVAPPEIYLNLVKNITNDSQIILCAQNVDINLSGAFTGETSAKMLKDMGVKYVIIGHSERRIYHKESDELIAKKFAVLKTQGLIPVLCIGETEVEKELGHTKIACARQIDAIMETHGVTAFEDAVIAYEPTWAIGTGKSATKTYAQEIHAFIRNYIAKKNAKIADQIIIQYGGSVNTTNAAELFIQPDIDGALIGSASLKAEDFTVIVKTAETAK